MQAAPPEGPPEPPPHEARPPRARSKSKSAPPLPADDKDRKRRADRAPAKVRCSAPKCPAPMLWRSQRHVRG